MSRLALLTAGVLIVLVGAFPAAASAKGGSGGSHGHGGGGGGSICSSGSSNCGFDVSYPQCGATLPTPAAFAIVGVNDGLANDYNPCLSSELAWAEGSTGTTPVSLYVNTADPGNMYNGTPIADWPTDGGGGGYGTCSTTTETVTVTRGHHSTTNTYTVGENSDACAWQYGYNMVQGLASSVYDPKASASVVGDVSALVAAADTAGGKVSTDPATYTWWLDVETGNSWLADTSMNVADLQGMIAGFQTAQVTSVGAYSTSYQWNSITGGTSTLATGGSLFDIPNWIPGATSESGAQSNCSQASFTGGTVTLTQWTGTFDSDYTCPAA